MANHTGQQLGNYRLSRLLGAGGFARVYLGEHIHLGTLAAIKVLDRRLTDEEVERFRNEARTILHLEHPNIVRMLDFGIEDLTPYLVMNYAPNGSLYDICHNDIPLPLERILPYVRQIASALNYAHDNRVIHRDVKPQNMLQEKGNIPGRRCAFTGARHWRRGPIHAQKPSSQLHNVWLRRTAYTLQPARAYD